MSRRGWTLFAAMSVIWGIPYLLIKVAVAGVPVPVLVLARVGVGAALLLPLALRQRQLGALRPHWRWLAAFAIVEIIAPWLLLSEAERKLTSSMSGLLVASVPIIVVVLARLTGGTDRLTVIRWAGLLAGLGGVALLAAPAAAGGDALSVAEVLLVAVCYATGPLIASRKLSDLPPLPMTAVCLGLAAVVYAPLAALTWPSVGAVRAGAGRAGGLGGHLHGCGVPALLPADRGGRPGPGQRDHVRQSGGRGDPGRRRCSASGSRPAMGGAFALILGGSVLATRGGGRAAAPPRTSSRGGGACSPRYLPAPRCLPARRCPPRSRNSARVRSA